MTAPLSYGQQRMWLLSQLAGSAAVNLVMAARLRGALNPAALRQAFDDIAARHTILRSVIVLRDGEPVQVTVPPRRLPLRLVDLSGLPSPAARARLDAVLHADARRPFDAAAGPLIRVTLVSVSAREHVVAVAMHHAITDGWSVGLLAAELAALYRAYATGGPAPLRTVPAVQYSDFARWQRGQIHDVDSARAERLRAPPLVGGPTGARGAAAVWTCALPPSLTNRVGELRRREGGSLFMFVVAALATVLHRLDGRTDVVIGTLAAGRTRPEWEPLLGYFVNVLPLLTTVDGELPFRDLWRAVREECVTAYAGQDVPYEKGGAGPVSVLCVQQQPAPPLDLPGLTSEPVDVPHPYAQFDLTLEVREHAGSVHLAFQYDTAAFDASTVEILGRHLRRVVEQACADVGVRCGRIPLPSPRVDPDPPLAIAADATLPASFEQQEARTPDAVALTHETETLTYGALNRRANQLARHMRSLGVGVEDRVAVCLDRSFASTTALLAVTKAGAAYVPLDPAYPRERLAHLLTDSAARCVVTTADLAERLPAGIPRVLLDADAAAIAARPGRNLGLRLSADHAAYVIYTSGSTGRPKGVVGTHRGTLHRLRWMWTEHPFATGERTCQRTPLSFVDSVAEVFGPLLRGVPAEVVGDDLVVDPPRLVDALARARVTRLVVVPSMLRMLLDSVPGLGARLPALALCVTSGEPLSTALAERFHTALPRTALLNVYGSTEVSADATAAVVSPSARRVGIGRAIQGATATVIDTYGVPAALLVAGELHVGGPVVARGYHRQPAATADRFVPAPMAVGARAFRTGDRARVRADGELDFLGRVDDQVQIRGMRVEPGEVEEALLRHPAVAGAAVTAWPDAGGTPTLVGYVVQRETCTAAELRAFVRRVLPPQCVPSAVVMLDRLPQTPSGKLDRRRLPPPANPEPADRSAPGDPSEAAVAAIFAELLPIRWQSVHDDFFTLGGHSILATLAVHRLRQHFGVDLTLRDLFDAPTIAGLARRAAQSRPDGAKADVPFAISPLDRHEPFPLTDVQQAYWVGRDGGLELGNVATHSYFEVDIEALDLARLTGAVRRLVERHAALRTIVGPDGRQQVLRDPPQYELPTVDLRDGDADAYLTGLRDQMSHQILPADRWPLFDLRVSLRKGGQARLHVSIDALIADAYSVRILLAELGTLYHRPDTMLEPLTLTFRDCVLHQTAERRTPAYDKALAYWNARLAELPAGPDLPLARAPSAVEQARFVRRSTVLAPERWARFCVAAATIGSTPSGALLGAFTEVLTAWSRRPHYTLTLTLFNRLLDHPEINQIVGDFTSLTLLEVDHRAAGSFAHRIRALQERMWTDLDHRAVSAVTVMRERHRRHGGRPRLLAPVVFTSNLGVDATDPDPLGERGFGITQTPQLYLDHQVAYGPDGLVLNWDSVADLFPDGLVDDMYATYVALVEDLADGRRRWDEPVGPLLPTAQRRHRAAANATAFPRSADRLHTAVLAAAARNPSAPAVLDADRRLTHEELVARSARVAHGLRARSSGRGDLVGIAMAKGWQQVVAALGVSFSGSAYVPLDPSLPARRLAQLADQCGLRTILIQGRGRLPGLDGIEQLAVDDETQWTDFLDTPPGPTGDDRDLAYVTFTSGSTGVPKGVMIDHRGAVNTIADINQRFRVRPDDRVLALSSLSFDLSVYDIFGLLAAGGSLVLPGPEHLRDPAHWIRLAAATGVTIWNSVPALMSLAVDAAEQDLGRLRLALLSGDWIPLDLPDRVRHLSRDVEVVSLGGATEASIWSVCHPIDTVDPAWTSIPYGTPLTNQRLYVLDAGYHERPDWVAGDLYIGGAGLAHGYWRDPDRTADAFVQHPTTAERLYRTGDIARYRPGGTLDFLGREDLQVKINGFRVELGEIEAALGRVPGVAACAVTAVGPQRGEKRLAAYYVPEDGATLDPSTLRDRLRATLPAYLVPGTFTRLDALPLTPNGKLDRSALGAEPPTPQRRSTQDGGLETLLAQIWQQVLDVPAVDRHDNFFTLGGTSLVAIRLLARLEAGLGVKIPLVRLFDAPSVAELAAVIAEASAVGTAAAQLTPDPAARHEPFPMTAVQEAYWLGRRPGRQLGGVATHSYVELDVAALDLDRLRHALQRLVDRHDALRTVVRPDGTQHVLAEPTHVDIPVRDLRGYPAARVEAELQEIRDSSSHRVRDPARWPLFEIAATRPRDNLTRLHIGVDLMIADALSFRILQRELLALYHGVPVTPLACTFRDYLVAVEGQRDSAAYRAAERYWRDRLTTLPTAPALPLREPTAGARFERCATTLPAEDWSRLQQQAAARQLTPSGVLCAAFAEILAMWSQSGRFTLNLTVFNRQPLHPDVDALVGDFTSTTLLEVQAGDATFEARAGRLQRQLLRDLEHRQFGGVEVARLLRADPRRRTDAIAPIVFTSMLVPETATAPAWDARTVYAVSQTPQVLLDHQVSEHAGALVVTWDHVADAFPEGMVEAMFSAYQRLLHGLLDDGGYWKVAPAWTL